MSDLLVLLGDTLKAQEAARLAELNAGYLREKATYAEAQLKMAMAENGVRKLTSTEHHLDVSVVTRKDVRITDAAEFAAAMTENGMEPPMTEPKFDTIAMKKIAKNLPDFPGAEPFETVYLKWTGHAV